MTRLAKRMCSAVLAAGLVCGCILPASAAEAEEEARVLQYETAQPVSAVVTMPGFLVGLMFTMAIKLRKSPFDLSTSHHAHQEIVKGLTTEMAGPALAVMNIAEYYEVTLMLGLVALFFLNSDPLSWPVAVAACLLVYFLEILWDNVSARVKWKVLLDGCWVVTLLTGGLNGLILMLVR